MSESMSDVWNRLVEQTIPMSEVLNGAMNSWNKYVETLQILSDMLEEQTVLMANRAEFEKDVREVEQRSINNTQKKTKAVATREECFPPEGFITVPTFTSLYPFITNDIIYTQKRNQTTLDPSLFCYWRGKLHVDEQNLLLHYSDHPRYKDAVHKVLSRRC